MLNKVNRISIVISVLVSVLACSNAPEGSSVQDIAERKDNVVFYRITSAGGDFIARRYCRLGVEPTRDCPLNPDKPALILTKVTSFRGYLEPQSEKSTRPRSEASELISTGRCIEEIKSFLAFIEESNFDMDEVPMSPRALSRYRQTMGFVEKCVRNIYPGENHSISLNVRIEGRLYRLGKFSGGSGFREYKPLQVENLRHFKEHFTALIPDLRLLGQNWAAGQETSISRAESKVLPDRYLAADGLALVEKEIADIEDFLKTPTHTEEEISRAKADLVNLFETKRTLDFHESILGKMVKGQIILPDYSQEYAGVSAAFERARQESRYTYDTANRIWWVHLGLRNYYDATGTSRGQGDILARNFLVNKPMQSSCAQKFGAGYRLPTRAEIAAVVNQKHMQGVEDWTSGFADDGQVGNRYYEGRRSQYDDDRHHYREIYCVINAG